MFIVRTKAGVYAGAEIRVGRYGEIRKGRAMPTKTRLHATEYDESDALGLRSAILMLTYTLGEAVDNIEVVKTA